ncbi:MAG: hypothetical protein K0Q47_64 [Sedimentibacter sp.]|jgi:hypothetical protein|nr:hypothetical protein [Sedimentibacter sp.]
MKYFKVRKKDKSEVPTYYKFEDKLEVTKEDLEDIWGKDYEVREIDEDVYNAGQLIVEQGLQNYVDLANDLAKGTAKQVTIGIDLGVLND